jgi:hypothetical protein
VAALDEKICDMKHRQIEDKFAEHSHRLSVHGKEIDELKESDAVKRTQIDNLTKAISSQTKAIWGLVCSVIATLGGFFIWYIQSLQ